MVKDMQTIVNFCKSRGFMYQGSEIYGGIANVWDFGPLGCRLKNNIKDAWRKRYIQERENSYEIDAAILMHPKVWEASGHVTSFFDPKMDCKKCKTRFRADNFITDISKGEINGDGLSYEEMEEYIETNNIKCPVCGAHDFTKIRKFSQMFEITPGNFNFRTIEFEQMEFQTFCKKGNDSEIYNYFKEYAKQFFKDLGLSVDNLRFHDHEKLAHYAKEACDIEYKFPFGWGEINGTHNRTDYDLKRHQEYSGKSMEYLDIETNEKYIPYIIESTIGPDRTVLAVLCEAYTEEMLDNNETRIVLKLNPVLSPYKIAILPLTKKQSEKSKEILKNLSKEFMCTYDESGTIGKRYRRQDEIGTPYCITIDYDTEKDECVTIRNRDTMEQERIKIEEISNYIQSKLKKYMI